MVAEELVPRYPKQFPGTSSAAKDPSHNSSGRAERALTKIRDLLRGEVGALDLAPHAMAQRVHFKDERGRSLLVCSTRTHRDAVTLALRQPGKHRSARHAQQRADATDAGDFTAPDRGTHGLALDSQKLC
jgi:hypothetical protein